MVSLLLRVIVIKSKKLCEILKIGLKNTLAKKIRFRFWGYLKGEYL